MRGNLNSIQVTNYKTQNGALYPKLELTYQIFGAPLESSSKKVLICHALTGNSEVTGPKGWWKEIVGPHKLVDTKCFTVIAIDIPGNGFDGKPENLIPHYEDFTVRDIAILFVNLLERIEIHHIEIAIGGSLGGGICWELAVLFPDFVNTIIPVAADWKATDWILANNRVQMQILENSKDPLHDARMAAMLWYRTPESFKSKFDRSINEEKGLFNVESWLFHHGEKLRGRFTIEAYRLMTNLLSTLDITKGRGSFDEVAKEIKARIILVAINTDLCFVPEETTDTFTRLRELGKDVEYHEIKSIHGHDAFLIEFDQLSAELALVFNTQQEKKFTPKTSSLIL